MNVNVALGMETCVNRSPAPLPQFGCFQPAEPRGSAHSPPGWVRNYHTIIADGGRISPLDVIVWKESHRAYYWYVCERKGGTRPMTSDECDQVLLECMLDDKLRGSSLFTRIPRNRG